MCSSDLPVYNEIGIDGVANSACTLTDDSVTAVEYVYQNITIVGDTATHDASIYILKDSDETRFSQIQFSLSGGTTTLYHIIQFNTAIGALNDIRNDRSDEYGIESVYRGGRWWWRLWLNITNNGTGNTNLIFYLIPAVTTTWGGQEVAATGSIVVDGCQVELNQTRPSSPSITKSNPSALSYSPFTYPILHTL